MQLNRTATINLRLTGEQFQRFGHQAVLDGKRVLAILGPSTTAAFTADGNAALGPADVFVRLVNKTNSQIHEAIPLTEFSREMNAGQPIMLNTAEIDWTKSGLFFANAAGLAAAVTAGKGITLLISYE